MGDKVAKWPISCPPITDPYNDNDLSEVSAQCKTDSKKSMEDAFPHGNCIKNVDLCDECTDSDLNGEIKGVTKNCYDNMIKVYNFVGDKVAQWPDSCPPITDPYDDDDLSEVSAQCKTDSKKSMEDAFPHGNCNGSSSASHIFSLFFTVPVS